MTTSHGPLTGVRVIDLASVVMGPYAAQLLGDMGADVIKVEPPGGDLTRITRPQRNPGMGALALNVNRNKRGIVLDLKSPEGQEALLKLVEGADILLTNMRPGALRRLGLDYERLSAANPKLIYCNAQGFRTDSPQAGLAAYDEIVQASSGLVDLMRRATGTPDYVPSILADKVCALTITYSVLAALVHQRATGQGQQVEVPMTDTLLAFTMVEHLSGQTFEPPLGPTGFNRAMAKPHRAVRTKDGWACILPYTDKNIAEFFLAVGEPELAADERFQDHEQRAHNYSALYALVEQFAVRHTTAEWQEICGDRSIPFAPVLELDEAADNPYFEPLITQAIHPTEGPYRQIGFPVRFSATPATIREHCPTLGQHTGEVLAELGLNDPKGGSAPAG
ncbi:CaiB/BaiF CoA transferase family protein [Kibdelosporangium aridum]|uniref:Crotonobetainyl-CoA:carnitine CoA-transferase CaiB n=1 Tax=Kibdelosporangium aridum TaxID=2030 RepID=A0A1W2EN71_KIBAR|nr:CoA transferase [Kibdelosporangium aridum]SMD10972.1 Crotonobetainyl-CoA:carnitine CoA-transferase CaiB [Kibdelosporangium aridum]